MSLCFIPFFAEQLFETPVGHSFYLLISEMCLIADNEIKVFSPLKSLRLANKFALVKPLMF